MAESSVEWSGERQTAETDWVSAHVFHHDDLDTMLVEVVAPTLGHLSEERSADDFFFLRYWDGGQHLRLRVLPLDPARRERVEHCLDTAFAVWFVGRPTTRIDPRRYATQARVLARAEGFTSAPEPLQPANSLSWRHYRREHGRYGEGLSMAAAERHFTESSRIVLDVLRRGASPDERLAAASAMILSSWFVGAGRAEDVLVYLDAATAIWDDGADTWGQSTGESSEQQRAGMLDLARRTRGLVSLPADHPGSGTLVDWVHSISTLRDALHGCNGPFGMEQAPVASLLDLGAHLACNRLGLSIATEGVVRGLAAGAITELVQIDHRSG